MEIPKGWEIFFRDNKILIDKILNTLINKKISIFPYPNQVFEIFYLLAPIQIAAVFMNDKPYCSTCPMSNIPYDMGVAIGVPQECIVIPNKLKNIVSYICPNKQLKDKSLLNWVKDGIFLLNVSMTAEINRSHEILWKEFIIKLIVYLRLVNHSIKYILLDVDMEQFIDNKELIIKLDTPSDILKLQSTVNLEKIF